MRASMVRFFKATIIIVIRLYQCTLSPLFGSCCRFYPSCSNYALDALKHKPLLPACKLIMARLSRCHPWHPGGVDELKTREHNG